MPEQSPKDFCVRHGISKMTLSRWRRAGRIVVTPSGAIDAEASDGNLRDAGLGSFRRPARQSGGLAEQQRRREIALARLREQELRRRCAELITPAAAATAWRYVTGHVRAAIAAIPSEIAKRIRDVADRGQIGSVVRATIHARLTDLAQTELPPEPAADPMMGIPDSATKIEAETRKVGALARLRQLDVDAGAGAVVALTSFEQGLGEALMQVRTRLLALESRLPPLLTGAPKRVQLETIRRAIDEVLAELPAEPPPQYSTKEDTDVTTSDTRRSRRARGPGADTCSPIPGGGNDAERKRVGRGLGRHG